MKTKIVFVNFVVIQFSANQFFLTHFAQNNLSCKRKTGVMS